MPFQLADEALPLSENSWSIKVLFEPRNMCVSLNTKNYEEAGIRLREMGIFDDSNGMRTFYNQLLVSSLPPESDLPANYRICVTCGEIKLHRLNIPLDGRFINILELKQPMNAKKEYEFVVFKDAIKLNPLATLLVDDDWCDFELIVKPTEDKPGGSVRMNKIVLAAYSPVFKSMLTRKWKGSSKGQVELPTELSVLESFKTFLCTGQVPQDIEDIKKLLVFGNTYMICNLEDACTVPVMKHTQVSNVMEMLEFAIKNNYKTLAQKLICRARPKFAAIPVQRRPNPVNRWNP